MLYGSTRRWRTTIYVLSPQLRMRRLGPWQRWPTRSTCFTSCAEYRGMTIGSSFSNWWWTKTRRQHSLLMRLWSSWSRRRPRSSVRTAWGRKPYCSQKETAKEMPKEMPKEKAKAGRAGEVIRLTRIRATGKVNRCVSIAIRKGIRVGTARAWNGVILTSQRKAPRPRPRPRMIPSPPPPGIRRRWRLRSKTTGDRYRRKNGPFKGELVLGLYLNLSHLWRSKEVRSVYEIHQEGWVGHSRFWGKGSGQGHRTWGCTIELSAARIPPSEWSSCEECPACGRGTQLGLPIKAYGKGITDCPRQWLRYQDIWQSTSNGDWSRRSRKSCCRGTTGWRFIPVWCGCQGCKKGSSVERCI